MYRKKNTNFVKILMTHQIDSIFTKEGVFMNIVEKSLK